MTEHHEVYIPDDEYKADTDLRVFWLKLGTLIGVARQQLDVERLHGVLLSRLTRELRRDLGVEGAREVLQGYIDTMDEAAKGDRT